ncbi:FCS-Like Zinc finger 17-like [Magnolia sinica]|uniref:FCS-Like Zinc finger 17-like n=1 Tax=Magnolia sinica TaxID=86752 RepID=UPI00265A0EFF|nr:FCS-Like Zinc finger 17-like [Magnolia sinica]
MLTRTRSCFKLGEESDEEYKGRCSTTRDMEDSEVKGWNPGPPSSNPVGLRILIQRSGRELNVLNKPMLIQTLYMDGTRFFPTTPVSSFLKLCHLCKRKLSPDKDVYMYRGDQGFCSVECRCRQIFLDEMEERENFMKSKAAMLPPRCRRRGDRIQPSDRRKGIPAMA